MQHSNAKRIFLIRHARPEVSKKGLFSNKAARQFVSDYDAAKVEEFVFEQEPLGFGEIKRVYCSTLVRSQLTAQAIFGDDIDLVVDHKFREFERKIYQLPLLRLPINFWTVSARVLWFMGWNSTGIETFKQAKERAIACATFLAKDAAENNSTVLVAHGMLNRFIRAALKHQGWKQVKRGGNSFLSVTILEK